MQLQLREKGYTKVFSRGQVVLFTASLEILLLRKESQWGGGSIFISCYATSLRLTKDFKSEIFWTGQYFICYVANGCCSV